MGTYYELGVGLHIIIFQPMYEKPFRLFPDAMKLKPVGSQQYLRNK